MILLSAGFLVFFGGVTVFLLITIFLVAILIFAKNKLIPSGKINLLINDDEPIETEQGGTLLNTLQNNKIYLPSACGGGGTCSMCRCQVLEGGGNILPTESGYFTRKQQQEKWRLACQVKVKEDIKIVIPHEIMGIKKWECEVISNKNVATYIKEFVVKLPEGESLNFRSGGYVQIDVPEIDVDFRDINVEDEYLDEWNKNKMFDLKMKNPEPTFRAYSMANHPAENNIIMLNIRIATPPWDKALNSFMNVNPGICSSYIFSRKAGDKVTVSGPYGEFFIKDTQNEMMFIGGGAGMAPMRSHIFHLFHTLKSNRKVSFWYGARSRKEIFYEEHFREIEKNFPNFKFTIALSSALPEDNWEGPQGFIHDVIFENYLKNHDSPEDIEYYLCGPPQMNEAVNKMLYNLGVPKEMIAFDDFGA